MLKTGIYRVEELMQPRRLKGLFGGARRASITLYDQVSQLPNADECAEYILNRFSDGRGAYKRTYHHRFDDFDSLALGHIFKAFPADAPLKVHDAAVSDARTACDFFQRIQSQRHGLAYYASDCDPFVLVAHLGRMRFAMNNSGDVLEVVAPPFVFNLFSRDSVLYYPLNGLVLFLLRKFVLKRVTRRFRNGELQVRTISLFCTRAQELARTDSRFHLLQYDLLQPVAFAQSLHVVRTMNVLNPGYFDAHEIGKVIKNVFGSLGVGGIYIVGSNQEAASSVSGAVFRRAESRFEVLWRSDPPPPVYEAVNRFNVEGSLSPGDIL
jgi:hypothetical protein